MKIEIGKCDLCETEYRLHENKNYQEMGHIKLDLKGCYYIQMVYEKDVCAKCATVINRSIFNTLESLDQERQRTLKGIK